MIVRTERTLCVKQGGTAGIILSRQRLGQVFYCHCEGLQPHGNPLPTDTGSNIKGIPTSQTEFAPRDDSINGRNYEKHNKTMATFSVIPTDNDI